MVAQYNQVVRGKLCSRFINGRPALLAYLAHYSRNAIYIQDLRLQPQSTVCNAMLRGHYHYPTQNNILELSIKSGD
jgi:hypothetical protein